MFFKANPISQAERLIVISVYGVLPELPLKLALEQDLFHHIRDSFKNKSTRTTGTSKRKRAGRLISYTK